MAIKNKHHIRIHFWLAATWATVGSALSLLWRDSILWVALMSVYAIVVAHLAAYEGARPTNSEDGDA